MAHLQQRPSEDTIAGIPLIAFRCPFSQENVATLRIRLPRRYPANPLTVTVNGGPQLSAAVRSCILTAATEEAKRFSGEFRHEPHCLQVLSEAMLAFSSFAERPTEGTGAMALACGAENAAVDGGSSICREPAVVAGVRDGIGATRGEENSWSGAEAGSGDEEAAVSYLGRRLIYSHHIIASQKRTGILKAARELGLGGFSKVGAVCDVIGVFVLSLSRCNIAHWSWVWANWKRMVFSLILSSLSTRTTIALVRRFAHGRSVRLSTLLFALYHTVDKQA